MLTIKQGAGRVRTEHELPLSGSLFDALWPLTKGRRVQKRRYRIPLREFTVELDEYEGDLAGLLVAEVEFNDPETAEGFEAPRWFGVEVTEDPRYKNHALALRGIPSDGDHP